MISTRNKPTRVSKIFLQQTYIRKIKLSTNIKESLMMKGMNLFFKTSVNMAGIQLRLIRIQMKLITILY